MPAKKSDRQIAVNRQDAMIERILDWLTDPGISKDWEHFSFAANMFGISSMIDKVLADIPENRKDFRRDLLVSIATEAIRRLI